MNLFLFLVSELVQGGSVYLLCCFFIKFERMEAPGSFPYFQLKNGSAWYLGIKKMETPGTLQNFLLLLETVGTMKTSKMNGGTWYFRTSKWYFHSYNIQELPLSKGRTSTQNRTNRTSMTIHLACPADQIVFLAITHLNSIVDEKHTRYIMKNGHKSINFILLINIKLQFYERRWNFR